MNTPPFHPEWLVTFWLETPVINRLEPHLTISIIVALIVGLYFYKRKKKKTNKTNYTYGEERFQQLLTKQKMIEANLKELNEDEKGKGASDGEFLRKKKELEGLLQETKRELQQFIG